MAKKNPHGIAYREPAEPTRLRVTLQEFSSKGMEEKELDVADVSSVRFHLPDGTWFDVECRLRDGVHGLSIRGLEAMGIKLGVSNTLWIIPRGTKV